MAPIGRHEHRQQRVRGAGPSSVQAAFGFDFGALAGGAAKQTSLPPQRSARRTPVRSTPHAANGSAPRVRSASAPRSTASKRGRPAKAQAVTPRLGKRKRDGPSADVDEEDELSPNRLGLVASAEPSRRVGVVASVSEVLDDAPDELSFVEDGGVGAQRAESVTRAQQNGTPVLRVSKRQSLSTQTPARTPIADRINGMSVVSRLEVTSTSRSSQRAPGASSQPRDSTRRVSSASRFAAGFDTPGTRQAEDSEDELSPRAIEMASTIRASSRRDVDDTPVRNDADLDELSPMLQAPAARTTFNGRGAGAVRQEDGPAPASKAPDPPRKRGRPRKSLQDESEPGLSQAAASTTAAGSREKQQHDPQRTIPTRRVRPQRQRSVDALSQEPEDQPDELSPEYEPDGGQAQSSEILTEERGPEEAADADEQAEAEAEAEAEDQLSEVEAPPADNRAKQKSQRAQDSTEKPARKRAKFTGPKQAISVMRIKGSTVKGITVADTTRTMLQESLDYRLGRLARKVAKSTNGDQRKALRSEINLSLSFKESLDEKLMDLQDANDVLSANFEKMKLFKRGIGKLRSEVLALQSRMHEVALEHDDVQMDFDARKAEADARHQLNANMFDIEAAIQSGRRRAHREGRDDEGPEIPLHMLVQEVGRNVGSAGGGLLTKVQHFNGVMERAARWLEGRA